MNGLRNTINEVKTLRINIAALAKETGLSAIKTASLIQTGAALRNDDRAIALIAIAKRRM
jgi:hypothetical protein